MPVSKPGSYGTASPISKFRNLAKVQFRQTGQFRNWTLQFGLAGSDFETGVAPFQTPESKLTVTFSDAIRQFTFPHSPATGGSADYTLSQGAIRSQCVMHWYPSHVQHQHLVPSPSPAVQWLYSPPAPSIAFGSSSSTASSLFCSRSPSRLHSLQTSSESEESTTTPGSMW